MTAAVTRKRAKNSENIGGAGTFVAFAQREGQSEVQVALGVSQPTSASISNQHQLEGGHVFSRGHLGSLIKYLKVKSELRICNL